MDQRPFLRHDRNQLWQVLSKRIQQFRNQRAIAGASVISHPH